MRLSIILSIFYFVLFVPFNDFACEADLYPITLEEKLDSSDLIIRGKVIDLVSYWNSSNTLIYKDNYIKVDATLKGSLQSDTVIVQTIGGEVGGVMLTTSSLITYNTGEYGIFFLSENGQGVLETYSSKQGFLKYSRDRNIAKCPFFATNVELLEPELSQTLNVQFVYTNPNYNIAALQSISNTPSFFPSVITSGTGDTLTICGTGFGTSGPNATEFVSFADADNGGFPDFMQPDIADYVLWTDSLIRVIVPTQAGTGVIQVEANGSVYQSSDTLTIPYAILNTVDRIIPTFKNDNGAGGQTWTMNTGFFGGVSQTSFELMMDEWKCKTGINWDVAPNPSSLTTVGQDGTNLVLYGSVPSGVLALCYNFYTFCGGDDWVVAEQDIIFNSLTNWYHGTGPMATLQVDFRSTALHEQGHAHLLGHVDDQDDVMFYGLGANEIKQTLSAYNIVGGNYALDKSIGSTICGISSHVRNFPGGCTQPEVKDAWIMNLSSYNNSTCTGIYPIKIGLGNLGAHDITNTQINWSINGNLQTPYNWSGNLSTNEYDTTIVLTNYAFEDSLYSINIWIESSNGTTDFINQNDTVHINFHPEHCSPDDATALITNVFDPTVCHQNSTIDVVVINEGENQLNSAWVYFSDGQGYLDSVYWSGSLQAGDTSNTIAITTYNQFGANNTFTVWTAMPNGVPDTYPINDTTSLQFNSLRLIGNYTIGGVSPDYIDLDAAIADLDDYGVCGDVTFFFRNGVYPSSFAVDSILGISSGYTIRFTSESGNSQDVIITNDGTNDDFIFTRTGHLAFDHLSFVRDTASAYWRLDFKSGSKYMQFHHNYLNGVDFMLSANNQDRTADSVSIYNNILDDSDINVNESPFSTIVSTMIRIDSNVIQGQGGNILCEGYRNVQIRSNDIYNNNLGYDDAIKVLYVEGDLEVSFNKIYQANGNGRCLEIEGGTNVDSVLLSITNNEFIFDGSVSAQASAVHLNSLPKVEVIHNSISMTYGPPGTNNNHQSIRIAYCDSVTLINNIIANFSSGRILQRINVEYLNSDYNLYWNSGDFAFDGAFSGTTYPTFSSYASNFGSDNNSGFQPIIFAAPDYLLPINGGSINNMGTPIPTLPIDIDGNSRNPLTPDIGAYEFEHYATDLEILENLNIEDSSFCSGVTSDLIAQFTNNGYNDINSFEVYVQFNNGPVDTVTILQTIAPGQIVAVNIGNYPIPSLHYDVIISCGYVNNANDSVPFNNTATWNLTTKLDGIYSVGDQSLDFVSLADAITALNFGICGPVTFLLKDGIHNNPGTIGSIPDNNSTNTITIIPLTGDTSSVIVSATDPSLSFTIDGANYLTIQNIQFQGDFHLAEAHHVLIDTCRFKDGLNTGNDYTSQLHHINILNSHFTDYEFRFNYDSKNINVIRNLMDARTEWVFSAYSSNFILDSITISENTFNLELGSYTNTGIIMHAMENFEFSRNKMTLYGYGYSIEIRDCNTGVNIFKNNFLSQENGYFEMNNNDGLLLYNNSMNLGHIGFIGNTGVEFRNNIIKSYATVTSELLFFNFQTAASPGFISDNNLFFPSDTTQFVYEVGTPSLSFAEWQTAFNHDLNSYIGDPFYYGTGDLHSNSLLADSNALPLSDVTIDIDGDLRDPLFPDIGADEFIFDSSLVLDIAVSSYLSPLNPCSIDDSIIIVLENNSTEVLSSAIIETTVDGQTVYAQTWNGSIPPFQSQIIYLTSYAFTPGQSHAITTVVSSPNGLNDGITSNNTLTINYDAFKAIEIHGETNICGTDSIVLVSSWSDTINNLAWNTTDTNDSIFISTPGNYSIIGTDMNGCSSFDTVAVTWSPAPAFTQIDNSDTTFCDGETLDVTVNPVLSNVDYSWNWTGANTPIITINQSVIITLTVTDTNGCTIYDEQIFYEEPNPTSTFTMQGNGVMTVSYPNPNYTYQWLFNGDTIPGATDTSYIAYQDGQYSLITTNEYGCSDVSQEIYTEASDMNIYELQQFYGTVYPNPVKDNLIISFTSTEAISARVMNSQGQLVNYLGKIHSNSTLNVDNLANGVYYIDLAGHTRIRFVVIH